MSLEVYGKAGADKSYLLQVQGLWPGVRSRQHDGQRRARHLDQRQTWQAASRGVRSDGLPSHRSGPSCPWAGCCRRRDPKPAVPFAALTSMVNPLPLDDG